MRILSEETMINQRDSSTREVVGQEPFRESNRNPEQWRMLYASPTDRAQRDMEIIRRVFASNDER